MNMKMMTMRKRRNYSRSKLKQIIGESNKMALTASNFFQMFVSFCSCLLNSPQLQGRNVYMWKIQNLRL